MNNPLLDKEFLKQLDIFPNREIFVRITSLTWDEDPLEYIEGKATAGSVNIDGASALRRSCSLILVANELSINDVYWGLKSKFKLEIGLTNYIDPQYPDIIWFPQGIFIFTSFNTSQSTTGFTISVQGKDKMCLLDGSIGGSLPMQVDFGIEEIQNYKYKLIDITENPDFKNNLPEYYYIPYEYDTTNKIFKYKKCAVPADAYHIQSQTGKTFVEELLTGKRSSLSASDGSIWYYDETKETKIRVRFNGRTMTGYCCHAQEIMIEKKSIPLKRIILEAVHTYAKEPYHNIVINNMDMTGQELLEYRGVDPVYAIYNHQTEQYENLYFYPPTVRVNNHAVSLRDFETTYPQYTFNKLNYLTNEISGTQFTMTAADTKLYSAAKIEYGETAGYRETELTYAGDLIANIGESLTSVLDKIKTMLGEYEYFYDVDGRFIWQRKPTYFNLSWNNIQEDGDGKQYVMPALYVSPIAYKFEGNELLTAINNNPQLNNIKNDFSIWGVRKGVSGADIPIHYRLAIHDKPNSYTTYDGKTQYLWNEGVYKEKLSKIEELDKDFILIKEAIINQDDISDTKKADDLLIAQQDYDRRVAQINDECSELYLRTEAEKLEIVSDWREIIYQMAVDYYAHNQDDEFLPGLIKYNPQYYTGQTGYEQFYIDMIGFWRDLYDPNPPRNIKSMINKTIETERHDGYSIRLVCIGQTFEFENDVTNPVTITYTTDNLTKQDSIYTSLTVDKLRRNGDDDNRAKQRLREFSTRYEYYTQKIKKQNEDENKGSYLLKDVSYVILQRRTSEEVNTTYYMGTQAGFNEYQTVLLYGKEKTLSDNWTIYRVLGTDGYYYVRAKKDNYDWVVYAAYEKINFPIMVDGQPLPVGETVFERTSYTNPSVTGTSGYTWKANVRDTGYTTSHTVTTITKEINDDTGYDNVTHFNINVIEHPELLNYWFDFLDVDKDSEFINYSIRAIGDRAKVINDSNVKAIYYKEAPNFMFINAIDTSAPNTYKSGYSYINIPNSYSNYFSISAQGISAKEKLDDTLYQFTSFNESVSITSLPIYYLQPNTLIQLTNKDTKTTGDYIVLKITLPLAANGTMSISATKAVKRLY